MAPPVNRDVLIGAGPLAYIQPVPQGRGTDQPFELTFLSGVRTLRFRLWRVAVEAIKAHKTAAQIAQVFGVHPTQVGGWKKQALAGLPDIFGNGREQVRQQTDAEKDELYKQIGQLKVELDFLKKRAGLID